MSYGCPNEGVMNPDQTVQDEAAFAERISELRTALRGYVFSILPHHGTCDDVVQETCLFLWENREDYRADTNFKAWAFRVAWFKAMACRRDHARGKIVNLPEDTLRQIAEEVESLADEAHDRLEALRRCLARLSPAEIALLRLKYVDAGSLTAYAHSVKQQPARVQKTLSRIRLALRHCIEKQLSLI